MPLPTHRPLHHLADAAERPLPLRGILTLLLVSLLAACGAESPEATPAGPAEDGGDGTAATAEAAGTADDAAFLTAAGIRIPLPASWEQEQPSSPMRLAQATVPGPGGEGQLTVFFFGPGGGGSAEANLDRWIAQIADAEAEPTRESFESGDFLITMVRHTGTLKASTMGTFPSTDQPGYSLLGAVVEGPGGPWFFKVVAPQETAADQAAAFRSMLEGIEPAA